MVDARRDQGWQDHCRHPETGKPCWTRASCEYPHLKTTPLWCWTSLPGCPARKGCGRPCGSITGTPRMPMWGWCTGWTPAFRPDGLCPHPRRPPRPEPTDHGRGVRPPKPIAGAGLRAGPRAGHGATCPAFLKRVPGGASQAGQTTPCRLQAPCGTGCSRIAAEAGCSWTSRPPQGRAGSRAGIPHCPADAGCLPC